MVQIKERIRKARNELEPLVAMGGENKRLALQINEILNKLAEVEGCFTYQRPTHTKTEQ